jgi:hypothetical protein
MSDGPWVLWHYDRFADDNRGEHSEYGNYRYRRHAEVEAERCNAPILDRLNAERRRKFETAHRGWLTRSAKHKALAAAGLADAYPALPDEPVFEELTEIPEGHCHYYVAEMEFEDAETVR